MDKDSNCAYLLHSNGYISELTILCFAAIYWKEFFKCVTCCESLGGKAQIIHSTDLKFRHTPSVVDTQYQKDGWEKLM